MRYRLRWGKHGKLRFLSHHDEALVFERAARRAGLPLAYSRGFTPHPKIAFGSGLPVGYGSEVELLDIELTEELSPNEVVARYNRGLPEGLLIGRAVALPRGVASLGAIIHAADYEVACGAPWLADRLAEFLALESYEITKPYKGGFRTDDLRIGVLGATVRDGGMLMRCAIQPRSTRPSDVLAALEKMEAVSDTPATFERKALLTRRDGRLEVLDEETIDMKVAS